MKVHLHGLMMKLVPVHLNSYLSLRKPIDLSFVPTAQELRNNLQRNCAGMLVRQGRASLGGRNFLRSLRGNRRSRLSWIRAGMSQCISTNSTRFDTPNLS
jgi:hypothetical protein